MKLKFLNVALGVVLSATALSASAQKAYTEGKAVYTAQVNGMTGEATVYFKGDSSATVTNQGPAKIVLLSNSKTDYLAVLVDVPVANIKKAGIATPAEMEEAQAQLPQLTFTPTTETKQISGFNCKKVIAKDKDGKAYDTWVTTDFTAPLGTASKLYAKAGGYPVQFTVFQNGMAVTNTLKSIDDSKAPAGTYAIPAGFDKISLTDLKNMAGGGR
ncbi:DUF4412 domain-containing protein [Mucilaginibacter sp. KACC 22063]|uniref:DUF4412 domain-containing protein n=1 Tax=Mucilaginibacter sp. KACC 22063 TaxID=3025666 RepID=UPI002366A8B4|nr:DUF4412 domain-containing protein [Mucilaginibacter sp. KACC 22063]WDF53746.1 hypothetical protein PQ461_12400 [Mucilaginibacter sp. KACC 22063]